MLKQVHIYIKGDVIGVGFRAWTKIQAKIRSVNGWVKNTFDKPETFGREGGVEAILQGEETKVNELLEEISRGSPVSRVDDVETYWQEPREIFEGFQIQK